MAIICHPIFKDIYAFYKKRNQPSKPTTCNLCVITKCKLLLRSLKPCNSQKHTSSYSTVSHSPVDVFKVQLQPVDGLWSYLFSAGGVCVSLLRQADCGPVLLLGHLYTLPSYHTPTGPRGHAVKHFLRRRQDSWQIKFFLLTGTRITLNLLNRLQECTPGFSRNKRSVMKWTNSCCLCFGISKQTPNYTKVERLFLFHIRQASHCAELSAELLVGILIWHAAILDYYPKTGLSGNI